MAAREVASRAQVRGRLNGTRRRKAPWAREVDGVGAADTEWVLVLTGSPLGGEPEGTTGGARGQLIGPVEVDNAETGRGPVAWVTREVVREASAGLHDVNSCGHSGPVMPAMASRRRCGRDDSSVRVRARTGGSDRSQRSEGRKPSSLRVGWSLGVHDNKLVAEVGERRHPLGASGVSASKVTWGRVSSGPITLTGRVRRRDSKLVFQPREVWRLVAHSRSTSLTK